MTKIIYRHDGIATSVIADQGDTVMATAIKHGVQGINGDCGGVLSCATCHVYVAPEWWEKVGPPSGDEEDMLEAVVAERRATSRLSCQIEIASDLDGLVVDIPPEQ